MFNSQAKQRPCLVLSCGVPGVPRDAKQARDEVQGGALHALPALELRFQRNSQGTPGLHDALVSP